MSQFSSWNDPLDISTVGALHDAFLLSSSPTLLPLPASQAHIVLGRRPLATIVRLEIGISLGGAACRPNGRVHRASTFVAHRAGKEAELRARRRGGSQKASRCRSTSTCRTLHQTTRVPERALFGSGIVLEQVLPLSRVPCWSSLPCRLVFLPPLDTHKFPAIAARFPGSPRCARGRRTRQRPRVRHIVCSRSFTPDDTRPCSQIPASFRDARARRLPAC